MIIKLSITLLTLVFSTVLQAETESWYLNASIGFSNKDNPAAVEQVLSSAENNYDTNRVGAAFDIGIYWPVFGDSFLLGVVANASIDSVQDNNFNEILSHDLEYVGVSVIKYIGETFGKGIFVRGDIGDASAKYRYTNNGYEVDDGSGSATLIGIGYSKPIFGNRTRLNFSLNVISSNIENREYSSNQLMFGFMW